MLLKKSSTQISYEHWQFCPRLIFCRMITNTGAATAVAGELIHQNVDLQVKTFFKLSLSLIQKHPAWQYTYKIRLFRNDKIRYFSNFHALLELNMYNFFLVLWYLILQIIQDI